MTLTEFLLARIAEDEKLAHDAVQARYVEYETSPEWVYDGNPSGAFGALRKDSKELRTAVIIGQASSWDDSTQGGGRFARHIVNWDPARVLAECEAKRQILETREKLDCISAVDDPLGTHGDGGQLYTLDWVLQRLALPYVDHRDYQPGWHP